MAVYNPDRWVLIHIQYPGEDQETHVYSGNYGGFAGSNTWKLSTRIEVTEVDGDIMRFTTMSGSTYQCHRNAYGMSGYMAGVWATLESDAKDRNIVTKIVTQEELFGK